MGFLLFVVRSACRRFEERVGQVASPRGAKTELVLGAISGFSGEFTLAQLERACPGVSRDMIRRVLRDQAKGEAIRCLGRGPGARWRRLEKG